MSFILDALKKSESDRQRQSGPALYEVKVAPPRGGLPTWAVAVVILLAVNLLIGLWMLMRHPGTAATTENMAPVAAAPAAPAAPAAALTVPPAAGAPGQAPSVQLGAAPAAAAVAAPVAGAPATAGAPTTSPAGAEPGHAEPLTPEDFAPAAEPTTSALSGHVRRGTGDGVALYQDAASAPGTNIPQLRLDLHAYSARAQDRFVMINMHKVHEGDTLPEGVRVDSITPEGAVLSYKGRSFLLPRD
jgi:general secretion pathway protein B